MDLIDETVFLLACPAYQETHLMQVVERLLSEVGFSVRPGMSVFLKPNLVTGTRKDGLACTHPIFVRCVARWFLQRKATVVVGDSPAFGCGLQVMKLCGIARALADLDVCFADESRKKWFMLDSGIKVALAAEIFECDMLINLPKIKAHSQMLVTLAVKNLFGAMVGCRKALAHMRFGGQNGRFERVLVDLLKVLPGGLSLVDGIETMHKTGPVDGEHFSLGLIGASRNPVALDSALLQVLNADFAQSSLWQECHRRNLIGSDPTKLSYPLMLPNNFSADGFELPDRLDPIRFQLRQCVTSGLRRIIPSN